MKINKQTILLSLALACITGCALFNKSPQRTTHTSIEALGRSVVLANQEYVAGVLTKRYKTNNFPEVEKSYMLFQLAYSNAISMATQNTNLIGIPFDLQSKAFFVTDGINKNKAIK